MKKSKVKQLVREIITEIDYTGNGKKPPGYKEVKVQSCENCKFIEYGASPSGSFNQAMCTKYEWEVSDNWVCKSYTKGRR